TGTRCGACGCMHTLPKLSALRTPDQCSGGCGSFQRAGPIGGLANGIPLKARTPDFNVMPEMDPPLIFTGSVIAARHVAQNAAHRPSDETPPTAWSGKPTARGLHHDLANRITFHIRQTEMPALKLISELRVIHSQAVQDGRVEIVHIHRIFHD